MRSSPPLYSLNYILSLKKKKIRNTKQTKEAHKKTLRVLSLANYSWAWCLPQSVADIHSDTPQKKHIFILSKQLSTTNKNSFLVRGRIVCSLPLLPAEFLYSLNLCFVLLSQSQFMCVIWDGIYQCSPDYPWIFSCSYHQASCTTTTDMDPLLK